MDKQMYRCIDVWKFTHVSYRTLALWGHCPKKNANLPRFHILYRRISVTYKSDIAGLNSNCLFRLLRVSVNLGLSIPLFIRQNVGAPLFVPEAKSRSLKSFSLISL